MSKLLGFIRYLKMFIKLVFFDLFTAKAKSLSAFSVVPEPWQSRWNDVKEEDEHLLWSSIAFAGDVPSIPPYTEGWLIISNRGLYFACKNRSAIKLAFRRGSPPAWRWANQRNRIALCNFFFSPEDEWSLFLPRKENLFRARLFHFEARDKKCFKTQQQG